MMKPEAMNEVKKRMEGYLQKIVQITGLDPSSEKAQNYLVMAVHHGEPFLTSLEKGYKAKERQDKKQSLKLLNTPQ